MLNKKQITVKVCDCYSHYFDEDVSDSLIDFFSRDRDSSISRINDKNILKYCYCYMCLKEKFVSKKPTIVSDSWWVDLYRFNDCCKNVAVPSSGCLARFSRNKKEFSEICNICVNFTINTILLLFSMKIITVSILIGLFFFIAKTINGTEDCLFGFCFGISYLCGVYFAHWLCSYFLHKKKIQELSDDIDKIFLDENFLVRFKNELRKRQENINE